MILARQGAADAQCRVSTDGKGSGQLNFAFSLRRQYYAIGANVAVKCRSARGAYVIR